ncbi:MAG: DUF3018 family protein [Verrucomicrobia bacterium]|nr:DUF3018 family protein [Verrucomicrobiota bacterium]
MQASERMKDYRARLRKQGLKPVQIWVPDARADGFDAALRRQVESLDVVDEREALEFVAEVAEWPKS